MRRLWPGPEQHSPAWQTGRAAHRAALGTAPVCLGIDGVLADTWTAVRDAIAACLDVEPAAIRPGSDWDFPFRLPAGADFARGFEASLVLWTDADVLGGAAPLPGAVHLAQQLAVCNRLAGYITRRPSRLTDATAAWLSRHGFPPAAVMPVGEQRGPNGLQISKAVTARALGAGVLVEDSPHEIDLALAGGIDVLGLVRPASRAAIEPHVRLTRIGALDEALLPLVLPPTQSTLAGPVPCPEGDAPTDPIRAGCTRSAA